MTDLSSMPPVSASRLSRWHRRCVVWGSVAIALSGLVWMAGWYAVMAMPELDGPQARSRLHDVVVIHGVLGLAGLLVIGSLLGRHVPAGLKSARKLKSGVTLLGVLAALGLTALGLYYSATPDLRDISSLAHQGVGVAAIIAMVVHVKQKAARR